MADLPRDIGFDDDPVVLIKYSTLSEGTLVPIIVRDYPNSGDQKHYTTNESKKNKPSFTKKWKSRSTTALKETPSKEDEVNHNRKPPSANTVSNDQVDGSAYSEVITFESFPTGIKSQSLEPEFESSESVSSTQSLSKSNKRLQKTNQDLSRKNLQLSKSVENLRKEREQLIADKERLKSEKKALAKRKSGSKNRERSMSLDGSELEAVMNENTARKEYELQSKLATMEQLATEQQKEIEELRKQLTISGHLEDRSQETNFDWQSQESPAHSRRSQEEAVGSDRSLTSAESGELKTRIQQLERELKQLQLQQRKGSPDPSPSLEPKQRRKFFNFRRSHRHHEHSGSFDQSPKSTHKKHSKSSTHTHLESSVSDNDLQRLSTRESSEPTSPGLLHIQAQMRTSLQEKVELERKIESAFDDLRKAQDMIEQLTAENKKLASELASVSKERDALREETKMMYEKASSELKSHTNSSNQQAKEINSLKAENQKLANEVDNLTSKLKSLEISRKQIEHTSKVRENELLTVLQRKQEELELMITCKEHGSLLSPTKVQNIGRSIDPVSGNSPPKWRRVAHQHAHPSSKSSSSQKQSKFNGSNPPSPSKTRSQSFNTSPSQERSSFPGESFVGTAGQPNPQLSQQQQQHQMTTNIERSAQPVVAHSPENSMKNLTTRNTTPPTPAQPSPSTGQMIPTTQKISKPMSSSVSSNEDKLHKETVFEPADHCQPVSSHSSEQVKPDTNINTQVLSTSLNTNSSHELSSSSAVLSPIQSPTSPPAVVAVALKKKVSRHSKTVSVPTLPPITSSQEDPHTPTNVEPTRKTSEVVLPSTTDLQSATKERRHSLNECSPMLGTFTPTSPKQTPGVNSLIQLFNKPNVSTKPESAPVSTTAATSTNSPSKSTTQVTHTTALKSPNKVSSAKESQVQSETVKKVSFKDISSTDHEKPSQMPDNEPTNAPKKSVLSLRKSFEIDSQKNSTTPIVVAHKRAGSLGSSSKPSSSAPLSSKGTVVKDIVKEVHAPTAITPLSILKPKPPPSAGICGTRNLKSDEKEKKVHVVPNIQPSTTQDATTKIKSFSLPIQLVSKPAAPTVNSTRPSTVASSAYPVSKAGSSSSGTKSPPNALTPQSVKPPPGVTKYGNDTTKEKKVIKPIPVLQRGATLATLGGYESSHHKPVISHTHPGRRPVSLYDAGGEEKPQLTSLINKLRQKELATSPTTPPSAVPTSNVVRRQGTNRQQSELHRRPQSMILPANKHLIRATSFQSPIENHSKKSKLLRWCQIMTENYDNVCIRNFGASFSDGLAFCALLHHFLPDKIPYETLSHESERRNFEIAFSVAESVGIPSLLDVDDMVSMNIPDWMSVMTYVSSIYMEFGNKNNDRVL